MMPSVTSKEYIISVLLLVFATSICGALSEALAEVATSSISYPLGCSAANFRFALTSSRLLVIALFSTRKTVCKVSVRWEANQS